MTISELIERIRLVPDEARRYECDQNAAERRFGLGEDTLTDLVERGLPHAVVDGGLQFEHGDLHYLGVRLGTARSYLWGLSRWANTLERFAAMERTRVRVKNVPQLDPAVGEVDGVLFFADGERRRVRLRPGDAVAEERGTLIGRWPDLPAVARRVAREIAESVAFYLLPESLSKDTELVRLIGLSDCLTIAPLIVEEWQSAGLDARVGSGMLVSLPYSTLHSWPEVRVGDTWVPADPLTLRMLNQFGGLDEGDWPPDRSCGPMLLPMAALAPVFTVDSVALASTFVTSLSPSQP